MQDGGCRHDDRTRDQGILLGRDMDEAVDYVMSIGPAGEIIRLTGDDADPLRDTIAAELAEHLAGYVEADVASGRPRPRGS